MKPWSKRKQKGVALLALALGLTLLAAVPAARSAMGPAGQGIKVPILMYHSVLKDPKMAGRYVVSPDTLEQDMRFLQQNGYTTVFVQDLVDYVYEGKALPEKPVVLTLDDGYLNNLTYVLPLLEKYEMKATISVVGKYTERFSQEMDEKPSYSHLTFDEIAQLYGSGRVEIGVHSYNLHSQEKRKGAAKRKGESTGEYQTMFRQDTKKALELLGQSGVSTVVYTYPYGAITDDSEPVLKEMGFKASLSCYEKENYLTQDPGCLWQMGRFNRPSGQSTETFMKKALDL